MLNGRLSFLVRPASTLAVAVSLLVVGAWGTAKLSVEHLLYRDAAAAAQGQADYLVANLADLKQIAAGQAPSAASQRLFDQAPQAGQVFRYRMFDLQGHQRLAVPPSAFHDAGDEGRSLPPTGTIAAGEPIVLAGVGAGSPRPSLYAAAYAPVVVGGRAVAIVEADVDQTETSGVYRRTLGTASTSLCLLTALALGLPALAWQRRPGTRQQADARVHYLASYNQMTGLPNRNALNDKLREALAALPAQGAGLAVHHIDIDRLKDINDTHGHDVGDLLIQTMAKRLCNVVGAGDFVAHLGGDEFAVVQAGVEDRAQAARLARRIADIVLEPFLHDGHMIATTASVGAALAPADGSDAGRLMKCADLALYKSKGEGRDCVQLFTPEMDKALENRLALETLLRGAIANDGFELHFQPAVDMPGGNLVGFEALLRLRSAEGAGISPALFVPVAEQMGLINRIGTWTLREACRTAATWPDHLKVAVNLSPAQFTQDSLSDIVAAALAETGLPAGRLELEITEGLLLNDSDAVMTELRKLKALGVAIVMDDFGTGYSSLSYLWRFPFDKIKIDRAFMKAMDAQDATDAETIVRTIITLARSLKMRVTVEGVEKDRHMVFVRNAECDQIQGYYFGRPMPVADLPAHILNDSRRSLPYQREVAKLRRVQSGGAG